MYLRPIFYQIRNPSNKLIEKHLENMSPKRIIASRYSPVNPQIHKTHVIYFSNSLIPISFCWSCGTFPMIYYQIINMCGGLSSTRNAISVTGAFSRYIKSIGSYTNKILYTNLFTDTPTHTYR